MWQVLTPPHTLCGVPTAHPYPAVTCLPLAPHTTPQAEREGRWWWEDAAAKECGLHSGNVKKADGTTEERKAERDLWPAGVWHVRANLVERLRTSGAPAGVCLCVGMADRGGGGQGACLPRVVSCSAVLAAPASLAARTRTADVCGASVPASPVRPACPTTLWVHARAQGLCVCGWPARAPTHAQGHGSCMTHPLPPPTLAVWLVHACRRGGGPGQGPDPRLGLRDTRQGQPGGAVRAVVPVLPGGLRQAAPPHLGGTRGPVYC